MVPFLPCTSGMTTTNEHLTIEEWLERARTLSDGTVMTDERMDEVFQMLNPANHGQPSWKYPIDAYVSKSLTSMEEIEKVVIWFCGGVPEIEDLPNDFHVTGAGYYGWVGA